VQLGFEHPPPPGGGGEQTKKRDTKIWSAGARRTHNRRVELHGELGANVAQLPSGATQRKFINVLIATNRRRIEADEYHFLDNPPLLPGDNTRAAPPS
jgi:hypothetical protein